MQCRLADYDALGSQVIAEFEKGAIPVRAEPGHDQIGMGFCFVGIAVTAQWTVPNISLLELQVTPTANAGCAHTETLSSLSMRCAAVNGGKDTYAKINGKGSRHICRPPSADSLRPHVPGLHSGSSRNMETL
ncbi:transposase domain protein (plasmid) [Ochrobactrum quorumnocens]|uniref:Transposase domain protein n=1 Tax=Ochrobactrum quorumnocens TaxID=271865 RepID=A0A248UMR7_9HYPH|nr:transposase domain protein [[Ochrobactrum] quorumnocens]